MTQCEQIQERITDLVVGQQSDVDEVVGQHVAHCVPCRLVLDETRQVHAALTRSTTSVPAEVGQLVLSRVHADLEPASKPNPGLSLERAALAVGGGLVAVLLHLGILSSRIDLGYLDSPTLVTVAAVWSALMISAFSWSFGRYHLGALDLGYAGLFGLLTSGLAAVGVIFCPQETYFALWEGSSVGQSMTTWLGMGASYGLFGLLYGLPPAVLVAAALGRRGTQGFLRRGLAGAGVAVLLLLPATYLQCAGLTLGVLAAWGVGALLGATAGMWSGVGLRGLIPAVQRVRP